MKITLMGQDSPQPPAGTGQAGAPARSGRGDFGSRGIREDLEAAERWLEKSSDARAEKVLASIARAVSRPPDIGDPDPLLKQRASIAVALSTSPSTTAADGKGADAAAPVCVAPAVQARKLITKVDPGYAAGSQAEGPMRFVVVMGLST